MPEHVDCNLCGSGERKLLYRLRDYRLGVDDAEWSVVQCRSCGLGYLDPRPTASEIARYYPPTYFAGREGLIERHRRQARYLPRGPGRLLDVGAGRGDFLALARDRGWEVEGIDAFGDEHPHRLAIRRIRFPEECDLPSERYDVVTAWAVFEHLHDPASAFAECARLLRPGGRLIVQVPNLRSVFGRWSLQEDVPRHLYFFSPPTLRRYGGSAGLRLLRIFHTTDLFRGSSGRGVLRLALVRALGRSTDEFFDVYRASRGERFRRWPLLATAWTVVSAFERLVLADGLVRALRISGQIVAQFEKPHPAAGPEAMAQ